MSLQFIIMIRYGWMRTSKSEREEWNRKKYTQHANRRRTTAVNVGEIDITAGERKDETGMERRMKWHKKEKTQHWSRASRASGKYIWILMDYLFSKSWQVAFCFMWWLFFIPLSPSPDCVSRSCTLLPFRFSSKSIFRVQICCAFLSVCAFVSTKILSCSPTPKQSRPTRWHKSVGPFVRPRRRRRHDRMVNQSDEKYFSNNWKTSKRWAPFSDILYPFFSPFSLAPVSHLFCHRSPHQD